MPHSVRAYFHDRERVARAVDLLVESQIPEDQIRVTVEDGRGAQLEEIPVKERTAVLRGAGLGAAGGAVLGVLAALLLAPGALLQAAVAGAAAGVPLGGIWGMGRWTGHEELARHDLDRGAAVVTVEGEALRERALEALRRAEPDVVRG